ncbi:hypothetical protein KALB_8395 [Kutzneria albida DSM 43870]|uniref:Uncharacterized protein n=1 Tax=Kutzneria albida DSM 43870 TaxID=1449976 RepID=W5WMJ9_9PSEU|nr:hypothetical protein KALB_8395 [Kutzneria albida DSM 43870]
MSVPLRLDFLVLQTIWFAAMPVGAYALLHALLQRADAFTAIDRMTKVSWSLITAGAMAGLLLFTPGGAGFVFWMAALVASLVYIVDVRPKLNEVQRGNKW